MAALYLLLHQVVHGANHLIGHLHEALLDLFGKLAVFDLFLNDALTHHHHQTGKGDGGFNIEDDGGGAGVEAIFDDGRNGAIHLEDGTEFVDTPEELDIPQGATDLRRCECV